jgi:TPR repeat protein
VRRWLVSQATDEKSAATLAERGYASDAFRIYARRAQAGDPDAQFQVGVAYLEGRGAPPSRGEALRWLERAAEQGHLDAKVLLASLLLRGGGPSENLGLNNESDLPPDFVGAAKWARAAAVEGSGEGQALLAHILTTGPVRDADEALLWYQRSAANGAANGLFGYAAALAARGLDASEDGVSVVTLITQAAEAGHIPAARALGQLYLRGAAVARDTDAAARWLQVAAAAGDKDAQADLGNLLLNGARDAVPHATLEKVRDWFAGAAAAGDPVAQLNLGLCFIQGIGGERHEIRGLRWMRDAAQHTANAQYWVGRMVTMGRGTAADPAEGRVWMARAAEAGLADAEFSLAEMMVDGIGGAIDHVCAARLLERAAGKGHVAAMFALGALKSGGYGIPADPAAARMWFTKAADLGHAEAKAILEKRHAAE